MDERGSAEDKLRRDCAAVCNQLAGYFARTLDEQSYTSLLANMTHLRTRASERGGLPRDVEAVMNAARDGIRTALSHLA